MGILADLLNEDGIRQQDLAICAFKDKGTIARGLKGLEDNGLVKRKIDPDDRRQKIINLTERGRRIFSRMEPQLEAVVGQITQDISEEDLRCCKKVLWQLYNTLQEQLLPETAEPLPTNDSHQPNISATLSH